MLSSEHFPQVWGRGDYWPRDSSLLVGPIQVLVCFWVFVGLGFCFVRAESAFRSSLLHLAAQVLAPGVGDVASALTSRAASAVGRLSPKRDCFKSGLLGQPAI